MKDRATSELLTTAKQSKTFNYFISIFILLTGKKVTEVLQGVP